MRHAVEAIEKVMNTIETQKLMERDDWELQLVLAHKKDPIRFPMDVPSVRKTCNEILCDCESGMVLGENWHGGMTQEEWKIRKEYIEKVLSELG